VESLIRSTMAPRSSWPTKWNDLISIPTRRAALGGAARASQAQAKEIRMICPNGLDAACNIPSPASSGYKVLNPS
jgi:hypothetical protein